MAKCGVGVCLNEPVDKGFCAEHQPQEFPVEPIEPISRGPLPPGEDESITQAEEDAARISDAQPL